LIWLLEQSTLGFVILGYNSKLATMKCANLNAPGGKRRWIVARNQQPVDVTMTLEATLSSWGHQSTIAPSLGITKTASIGLSDLISQHTAQST